MLRGPSHLPRPGQLQDAAINEHANVIADVTERLGETCGELPWADGLRPLRHRLEDLPPQRMPQGDQQVVGVRVSWDFHRAGKYRANEMFCL